MGVLKGIGAILIIAWLVLWLFVKITFAAVHLLVLIGIAMLIFGFIRRGTGYRVRSSSWKPPNGRALSMKWISRIQWRRAPFASGSRKDNGLPCLMDSG